MGACVLVQPELEFAVAIDSDNGWWNGTDSLGTVAPFFCGGIEFGLAA